jgi:hypothetical protein
MALRRTTGRFESLLRLVGLDWAAPDFSTLSHRRHTLALHIPYHGRKRPLRPWIRQHLHPVPFRSTMTLTVFMMIKRSCTKVRLRT